MASMAVRSHAVVVRKVRHMTVQGSGFRVQRERGKQGERETRRGAGVYSSHSSEGKSSFWNKLLSLHTSITIATRSRKRRSKPIFHRGLGLATVFVGNWQQQGARSRVRDFILRALILSAV